MESIKNRVIVWTPGESIAVQTRDFYNHFPRTHQCSWGGCNSEIGAEDDFEVRKALVFMNALQIIVHDKVPPKNVHNTLLCIEEYYDGLAYDKREPI